MVRWLCRPCHTYIHPKTQKNIGPVWRWPLQATAEDIAAAMAGARNMPVRHITAGRSAAGEGIRREVLPA